jgi:hypothetical protein
MESQLGTTNLFLGIMAAVSVLQALVLVGAGVAAFKAYRQVIALVESLEDRHVTPAFGRVNAILDDMKVVSAKVKDETERVDQLRRTVRARTSRIVGLVRGARVAIESMLGRAA